MKSIISDLISIEAVKIETEDFFTWTSGVRSPIYCDNRLTMSYPAIRKRIARAFAEKIGEEVDVIAGCATAGIPHAAWIADALELPMVYVRGSRKKHGKGNQIEGVVRPGQKAVVIEDLISTGKSSIQAAEALREAGVEVVEVLSIFTYGLDSAEEAFRDADLTYRSLATYNELMEELNQRGTLSDEEHERMSMWRKNPYIFTS
ncbi:orotate phosphoribosyltransferase [Halobacillus litoralis]|uniref:orotate phosphoribosyltransferase n=1 Tax=Halobacillus litoralis TaxID=45668 RepID=UPI001CD20311|nr:orotate phosphoribosyltransferase [Halobacillus litoralis]MCA0969339.1 orotate phosphoribosyltransferase [Halobacillus litoralis]